MKMKVFNKMSSAAFSQRDLTPLLTVNPKAGLLSFSQGFAKQTGMSGKSKINFIQDEEKPTEWYIQIADAKDTEAFPVRDAKGYLSFNNTAITRELLKACNLEGGASHRFLLSVQPAQTPAGKVYPIITKSAKPLSIKKSK